ncbi:MAG: hypothetical protein D3917_01415 [Candidatus Electrothrix sp. AX5]|nr:hypothetical protein [Candidatus Electrothrix sp. AX5]
MQAVPHRCREIHLDWLYGIKHLKSKRRLLKNMQTVLPIRSDILHNIANPLILKIHTIILLILGLDQCRLLITLQGANKKIPLHQKNKQGEPAANDKHFENTGDHGNE